MENENSKFFPSYDADKSLLKLINRNCTRSISNFQCHSSLSTSYDLISSFSPTTSMENNLSFPGLIWPSRNPFKHESGKVRFGWKKETETKLKFEKDCLDGRRKSIEL